MSFVTDSKALTYLRRYPTKPPINLREKYPEGSDDALRLLRQMLQFNPFNRPTVDELLNDAYFNDVRQFSKARDAPAEISLPFEESKQYVGIKQIRELFVEEINYYQMLKNTGKSQVSPSPIKNHNSQIFFNQQNSYQKNQKNRGTTTQNSTSDSCGSTKPCQSGGANQFAGTTGNLSQ